MTTRVLSVSVPVLDQELVRKEGIPAKSSFTDPDENELVHLEGTDPGAVR